MGALGALLLPSLDGLLDVFLSAGDHQVYQAGEFARGGVDSDGDILPGESGTVPGADEGLATPGARGGHAQRPPRPD